MRVALVKTSSMGDVIHTYPVVSDIRRALRAASVHWVVEEAFQELPGLHPGVSEVIAVAVRRWRRRPFSARCRNEIRAARARLAAEPFDLVLDLQGLIKSACICRWANGPRAGYAWACAREPLASLAYQRRYPVDMTVHAIERGRQLAAQAFGYSAEGPPRFELAPVGPRLDAVGPDDYDVFLPASSRADKQWPQANWQALGRELAAQGRTVVVAWGGEDERLLAESIARSDRSGRVRVLPRLTLSECARLLRDARAVVGVDTGLSHLAAALERPTITLFGATPAWRFGPYWTERAVALGEPGAWPSVAQVLEQLSIVEARAPRRDNAG